LTAPEVSGYDAETGKLVAAAMGVEPCFVSVPFDQIIAGNWGTGLTWPGDRAL